MSHTLTVLSYDPDIILKSLSYYTSGYDVKEKLVYKEGKANDGKRAPARPLQWRCGLAGS